jgi:hypothetical protein
MEIPSETTNSLAAPVLTRLGTSALSLHSDTVPEIDQLAPPQGQGSYA